MLETARQSIEPYAGASSFVGNILVGLTLGSALVAIGGLAPAS